LIIRNLYDPDQPLKEGELYRVCNYNLLPQVLIWILKERATTIVLNKQT